MFLRKFRASLVIAPALLLVVGAFAACGGDDDSSATTPTTAATQPAGSPAASATKGAASPAASAGAVTIPAGAPEVDQDGLAFKPTELKAKSGEKVYFKNSESALHTVTINGKNESGNMKKGDIFVWTSGPAGEYKITCDYHPQMKATITIS